MFSHRSYTTILFFSLLTPSAQASQTVEETLEVAQSRCLAQDSESEEFYMSEFGWGYTLLEMQDAFERIYVSDKRLGRHAVYDPEEQVFYMEMNHDDPRKVRLSESFIINVIRQIEIALEKGYADFVFFPDMGHSHLYFPKDHWVENYSNFDTSFSNHHKLYEKMFADSEMRVLYHLAEQLQMVDDDQNVIEEEPIYFKYWNRNYVGSNDGSANYSIEIVSEQGKYNTVGSIEGYHKWSAGFTVSANKDGCFPYRDKEGQIRYFDLALKDPRPDPSQSIGM